MGTRLDPEIGKYTGTDFTCITFFPDLARFKMDRLDEDIVSLFSKRAYDLAGSVISSGQRLQVIIIITTTIIMIAATTLLHSAYCTNTYIDTVDDDAIFHVALVDVLSSG